MIRKVVRKILKPFLPDPELLVQKTITTEYQRAMPLNAHALKSGKIQLPDNYGHGIHERVVEVLFARLSFSDGDKILDVGHANAMPCHLEMIRDLGPSRHITGIDISQPTFEVMNIYDESLTEDITRSTLPDNSFDLIWCISALEHFGMDNSVYLDKFRIDATADVAAAHEMMRLLKPGGKLLITVPYGRYEDNNWFRNYSAKEWALVLDAFRGRADIKQWYFCHEPGSGWHERLPESLANVSYYDQKNPGAAAIAVVIATKS